MLHTGNELLEARVLSLERGGGADNQAEEPAQANVRARKNAVANGLPPLMADLGGDALGI